MLENMINEKWMINENEKVFIVLVSVDVLVQFSNSGTMHIMSML